MRVTCAVLRWPRRYVSVGGQGVGKWGRRAVECAVDAAGGGGVIAD